MGFGNFRPHPHHCSKTPQLIYVKFEVDSTLYAKFQVLCRRGWSRQIASSSVKVCPFSHLFVTESRKLFFVFVPKIVVAAITGFVVMCTVVPERCTNLGLRRSQRTRVLPLEWHRCEKIDYRFDSSGKMCHDCSCSQSGLWFTTNVSNNKLG